MSKFKVGDKVYRLEDRKEADILWEVLAIKVMKGGDKEHYNYILKADSVDSKFLGVNNNNGGKIAFVNFEDDLELYKTPHERLLELGWEKSKLVEYIYYEKFNERTRRNMVIRIPKDNEGYYVDVINMVIDLELSKILTQYLEELENEK